MNVVAATIMMLLLWTAGGALTLQSTWRTAPMISRATSVSTGSQESPLHRIHATASHVVVVDGEHSAAYSAVNGSLLWWSNHSNASSSAVVAIVPPIDVISTLDSSTDGPQSLLVHHRGFDSVTLRNIATGEVLMDHRLGAVYVSLMTGSHSAVIPRKRVVFVVLLAADGVLTVLHDALVSTTDRCGVGLGAAFYPLLVAPPCKLVYSAATEEVVVSGVDCPVTLVDMATCNVTYSEASALQISTAAPSTQAPQTAAPSSQAPQAAVPSTQAPQAAVPSTRAPETAVPSTQAPETAAPSTQAPETAAPSSQAPQAAVPSTQAPETAAPSTQAPETAAPPTQAPETAAPSTQAPQTAVPSTQAPQTAAPSTQAPETAAPSTQAPQTAAPSTQAPQTAAPSTQSPQTAVPSTQAPQTAAPPSQAPQTAVPSTQAPETAVPSIQAPQTAAPSSQAPQTAVPQTAAPLGGGGGGGGGGGNCGVPMSSRRAVPQMTLVCARVFAAQSVARCDRVGIWLFVDGTSPSPSVSLLDCTSEYRLSGAGFANTSTELVIPSNRNGTVVPPQVPWYAKTPHATTVVHSTNATNVIVSVASLGHNASQFDWSFTAILSGAVYVASGKDASSQVVVFNETLAIVVDTLRRESVSFTNGHPAWSLTAANQSSRFREMFVVGNTIYISLESEEATTLYPVSVRRMEASPSAAIISDSSVYSTSASSPTAVEVSSSEGTVTLPHLCGAPPFVTDSSRFVGANKEFRCQEYVCPSYDKDSMTLTLAYDEMSAAAVLFLPLAEDSISRQWLTLLPTVRLGTAVLMLNEAATATQSDGTVGLVLPRPGSGWPGVEVRPYALQRFPLIVSLHCLIPNGTIISFPIETVLVVTPRPMTVTASVQAIVQSSQAISGGLGSGGGAEALAVGRLTMSLSLLSCNDALQGFGTGQGVISVSNELPAAVDTVVSNVVFVAGVSAVAVVAPCAWHLCVQSSDSLVGFYRDVLRLPLSLFPLVAVTLPSTVMALGAMLRDARLLSERAATVMYGAIVLAIAIWGGALVFVCTATRRMALCGKLRPLCDHFTNPTDDCGIDAVSWAFRSSTKWDSPRPADLPLFEGLTVIWFLPLDIGMTITAAVMTALPLSRSSAVCIVANAVNVLACTVMLVVAALRKPFATAFGTVHSVTMNVLVLTLAVCGLVLGATSATPNDAHSMLLAIGYLSGSAAVLSALKAVVDVTGIVAATRRRYLAFLEHKIQSQTCEEGHFGNDSKAYMDDGHVMLSLPVILTPPVSDVASDNIEGDEMVQLQAEPQNSSCEDSLNEEFQDLLFPNRLDDLLEAYQHVDVDATLMLTQ